MSLFEKIFGNRPKPRGDYRGFFKLLNGYVPAFSSWTGGIYEMELIRAAINTRATHVSKLNVEISGSAKPALRNRLKHGPNQFQSWLQFLYRLSTILDVHNTAFIVPIWDKYGEISGIYTPMPDRCEVVQYGREKTPFLRYHFHWGDSAAVELAFCGVMTKFQYRHDLFGETNRAIYPTMDLIHIQNQGIEEGTKSAATYRFWAQAGNFTKTEDLAKERKRFSDENFTREAEAGGLLLFPNTYTNINQVNVKPWVVDADQRQAIEANVYRYFGVNEDVLTNKAFGNAWSAFYEGVCEWFAIQFSEVTTRMLYTFREQTEGNKIFASANRLQYMTNTEKLAVSAQMADRGLMTRNEIREIWNLAPLPSPYGDQLPVRGEYYNVNEAQDSNTQEDE